MKPRVWLESRLDPDALARLETVADVIQSADLADLPGADAAVISSRPTADGAFMDRAGPRLKAIARPGIGVDNVNIPAATQRGILVVNTPDAPTESTAEHAVALLLALSKRVVAGDMSLRGAGIPRSQLLGTEARGRVLGVVGFGRVGRRVAEICARGLKMRVIAHDPYVDPALATALGVEMAEDLDELLAQADFVTLHPALTPETRGLIGERELRRMKPGAYLINTSRGPVVDEAALVRGLEEGHLAGAALDVFDPEPPTPDNPLLRMANVVVTPHIGSYTDLGVRAMSEGVVDQLLQIFRGERPPFLVNPEAWPGRVAGRMVGQGEL
ncbi:MAG TPA: hydroxyacid dehydrogenase [Anaerolineae bacterium]|nr:hydroxyacid dehydrogenase [Anaerolineae bacterium]